jgi:hypothetical protein
MTCGASMSAAARERTGANGPSWLARPSGGEWATRASERENAGECGPRAASGWAKKERGRREAARGGILFFVFKNVK